MATPIDLEITTHSDGQSKACDAVTHRHNTFNDRSSTNN